MTTLDTCHSTTLEVVQSVQLNATATQSQSKRTGMEAALLSSAGLTGKYISLKISQGSQPQICSQLITNKAQTKTLKPSSYQVIAVVL